MMTNEDEALTISALQHLPMELFSPLLKEALSGRQSNLLRAMVSVWPSSYPAPLGALVNLTDTLQAVLDSTDSVDREVLPQEWKLQVLDLRNMHHNF